MKSLIRPRNILFLTVTVITALLLTFWYLYGVQLVDTQFIDAKSFWLGARIAFIEFQSPYSREIFAQNSVATPGGYAHPFVYPPPSLVLLAPLAAMPFDLAVIALLVSSHIAFILSVVAIGYILFEKSWWIDPKKLAFVAILGAFIAISHASRVTLGHGQVNFYVICGLLWFWTACLGRTSHIVGAAGIIVASLLKPYFAIFFIYVLLPRGRRLFKSLAFLTLFMLSLTLVFVPLNAWESWAKNFLLKIGSSDLYLGQFPIYDPKNFALRAELVAVMSSLDMDVIVDIVRDRYTWIALLMLSLQTITIYLGIYGTTYGRTIQFCALLILVFLLSPISWVHYFLYIAISVAIIAPIAVRTERWILAGLAIATGTLILQTSYVISLGPVWAHLPSSFALLLWGSCITGTIIDSIRCKSFAQI